MMSIPQSTKDNFHTLIRALADDNVAILKCTLDGFETVDAICAVVQEGEEVVMTPFAIMLREGNPFERLTPAKLEQENHA
jgi:hypothetical protein